MTDCPQPAPPAKQPLASDEGYMLLAVVVMVFLVLLTLSVAAPRIALQLKRDREIETQHRAQQYVRAIRVYYKKFGHYPGSVEQLEKSNNQRFLRQRYLDPMTGKDDWKLIAMGQNKTTVKGFFGADLPGLGGGAGLGSAAGLQSGGPGATTGGTGTSGLNFGGPPSSTLGSGGNSSSSSNPGGGLGSSGGAAGGSGAQGTVGAQTGGTGTGGTGSGTGGLGGSGGMIMGVGVPATGEALLNVNEQGNYQDWEFLYDPRIEQMYAKGATQGATGAGAGGTGTGSGLGATPPGTGTGGLGQPGVGQPSGGQPSPVGAPTPQ